MMQSDVVRTVRNFGVLLAVALGALLALGLRPDVVLALALAAAVTASVVLAHAARRLQAAGGAARSAGAEERALAEARLRARAEVLEKTLEAAEVWTFALDGRRFVWTGAGVGLPENVDELVARTPTADRPRVAAAFEDLVAGRAPLALELR